MGELSLLLSEIKNNKDNFPELLQKMTPLINKYARVLYKDDSEDVKAEMSLALWEAVCKLEYYDDDGKCMTFFCTALRNKFLELYHKSRKQHDNCESFEFDETFDEPTFDNGFSDIVFAIDIENLIKDNNELRQKVCRNIIFDNESDAKIAEKHNVSRQYIHRLRRELYEHLKTYFIHY